jgi:hypothetical protein
MYMGREREREEGTGRGEGGDYVLTNTIVGTNC